MTGGMQVIGRATRAEILPLRLPSPLPCTRPCGLHPTHQRLDRREACFRLDRLAEDRMRGHGQLLAAMVGVVLGGGSEPLLQLRKRVLEIGEQHRGQRGAANGGKRDECSTADL